jgi:hypothetical protein
MDQVREWIHLPYSKQYGPEMVMCEIFNPTTMEEPFCGLRMTKDCLGQWKATVFHLLIFGDAC